MLKPIAQALNAVIEPSTQVWFAMQGAYWGCAASCVLTLSHRVATHQLCSMHADPHILVVKPASCSPAYLCACLLCGVAGEMSATVVREPQSWTKVVPRLKADIVSGRDDASALMPNLKVGVSTNFNKLCACVLMDLVDPNAYLTLLPAAMKEVEKEFNKPAIKELYDTVDFIGISSYSGEQAASRQHIRHAGLLGCAAQKAVLQLNGYDRAAQHALHGLPAALDVLQLSRESSCCPTWRMPSASLTWSWHSLDPTCKRYVCTLRSHPACLHLHHRPA